MGKLKAMQEGGAKLKAVKQAVVARIKPGVRLVELDKIADQLIQLSGGESAFKRVAGYRWATCINVNEGVVHGIPSDYEVREGDLVSLDVGMVYKGWHTDTSTTVIAGRGNREKEQFLQVGRQALKEAIRAARAGNRVGHISQAMEVTLKRGGCNPILKLTGHGIGKNLHEFPAIPCFLKGKIEATTLLQRGMTLAIEAIYAQGSPEVITGADGWTVKTADGKLAGLFEETVLVVDQVPMVLTA
ncbi:MAG: type I methionyl aminopeptidase [Candidatus Chisholmbacteria bacterium]|nr:type I methionyl aminopeptidase [Candidatus Chisholmbacteria bacterium]